jgi:hypothetical protein
LEGARVQIQQEVLSNPKNLLGVTITQKCIEFFVANPDGNGECLKCEFEIKDGTNILLKLKTQIASRKNPEERIEHWEYKTEEQKYKLLELRGYKVPKVIKIGLLLDKIGELEERLETFKRKKILTNEEEKEELNEFHNEIVTTNEKIITFLKEM